MFEPKIVYIAVREFYLIWHTHFDTKKVEIEVEIQCHKTNIDENKRYHDSTAQFQNFGCKRCSIASNLFPVPGTRRHQLKSNSHFV